MVAHKHKLDPARDGDNKYPMIHRDRETEKSADLVDTQPLRILAANIVVEKKLESFLGLLL